MSDLIERARAAGYDDRLSDGQLYLDLADRIEELENPGFHQFVSIVEQWLTNYPSDIFTGVSGDPGPLFVVAIRASVEGLNDTNTQN